LVLASDPLWHSQSRLMSSRRLHESMAWQRRSSCTWCTSTSCSSSDGTSCTSTARDPTLALAPAPQPLEPYLLYAVSRLSTTLKNKWSWRLRLTRRSRSLRTHRTRSCSCRGSIADPLALVSSCSITDLLASLETERVTLAIIDSDSSVSYYRLNAGFLVPRELEELDMQLT